MTHQDAMLIASAIDSLSLDFDERTAVAELFADVLTRHMGSDFQRWEFFVTARVQDGVDLNERPAIKRYRVSLGSDHGYSAIGYTAIVYAPSLEEALSYLQNALPEAGADVIDNGGYSERDGGLETLRVYFNHAYVTLANIEEWAEVEVES